MNAVGSCKMSPAFSSQAAGKNESCGDTVGPDPHGSTAKSGVHEAHNGGKRTLRLNVGGFFAVGISARNRLEPRLESTVSRVQDGDGLMCVSDNVHLGSTSAEERQQPQRSTGSPGGSAVSSRPEPRLWLSPRSGYQRALHRHASRPVHHARTRERIVGLNSVSRPFLPKTFPSFQDGRRAGGTWTWPRVA